MINIKNCISSFVKLGCFLGQFKRKNIIKKNNIEYNDLFFDGFKNQLKLASEYNSWFTHDNLMFTCENWSRALSEENIKKWIDNQTISENKSKTVAIVMAGNIPLVGFHDYLSVLISGHKVLVKQSSKDKHLLPYLSKYLEYINPYFKGKIKFTDEKLTNFDAVIATGNNNSTKYFEYYFKNKPNIIRKNRNSIAILNGNETKKDLENLGNDIFRYFGLGCRSVSKIFIPKNYNLNLFFSAIYNHKNIINNNKYANNYDYNKAVYLMSEFNILENGFLLVKEDKSLASPISTVFYEYYNSIDEVKEIIELNKHNIQCVVGKKNINNEIAFGKSQNPNLWDYADGINTLDFLSKI